MFTNELKKYRVRGNFSFESNESLRDKCNAPDNQSGVYLIYKVINNKEILIYIGSSGQKKSDGSLKIRKGGMKDRLINGYHPNRFGQLKRIKRHSAFPQQMQAKKISKLKFYWWVTFDGENSDLPTDVESILMNKYFTKFKKRPDWHK